MIRLRTISMAAPTAPQLSQFKAYASVAGNAHDVLLQNILKTAMRMVQETANTSLLRTEYELMVTEHEGADPVRLYGSVVSVESVLDGNGQSIQFARNGSHIIPSLGCDVLVINYTAAPAEGEELSKLLDIAYQYGTAMYDGAESETLANILGQC